MASLNYLINYSLFIHGCLPFSLLAVECNCWLPSLESTLTVLGGPGGVFSGSCGNCRPHRPQHLSSASTVEAQNVQNIILSLVDIKQIMLVKNYCQSYLLISELWQILGDSRSRVLTATVEMTGQVTRGSITTPNVVIANKERNLSHNTTNVQDIHVD